MSEAITQAKRESELVLLRIPTDILSPLRLACQATGRSLSAELLTSMTTRKNELMADPETQQAVELRADELHSLYGDLDAAVSP